MLHPAAIQLRETAERLAAQLPPLALATEKISPAMTVGAHGRRRRGPGENFWQYRPYQFGDDARAIDWRRSAAGERVYIREQEWQAAQSVWLWCDASASMNYSSLAGQDSKHRRAASLLLALAILLNRAGEHVALLDGFSRPAGGRAVIDRLSLQLSDESDPANRESLPGPSHLPRHASLVLAGDFLSKTAEIEARLRAFSARGIRGHLLHIIDPSEEDLPYEGRTRFIGPEGEGEITVGAVQDIRQAWRARLQARQEALSDLCRSLQWTYLRHRTDRPAQTALLALHHALQTRVS